jgi:hypothetical protein
MAATELGIGGLPPDYPNETIEWVKGLGETPGFEIKGERSAVKARFETLKTDPTVNQLTYSNREGRATLIGRFVRTDPDGGTGGGVTIIEELLALVEVRELYAAPLFAALADDDISDVLTAVELRLVDADIDGYAAWANEKKELRFQMLHGQTSYRETKFVLRIRKQGVRSSSLRGTFTGINTVVATPTLSSGMTELVGELPAGEWLYSPPQIEYVQRGIWSVSSEYEWALKWSVVYGGTLKGFMP